MIKTIQCTACILILFITSPINAQETTSIKVSGSAKHFDEAPVFYGSISLSETYSSYPEEAIALDQIKEKYDAALQKSGLSLKELKENPVAYTINGYEKEGMVYEYETSSFEDFIKFIGTRSRGVQRLNHGAMIIVDKKEAEKLLKEALQNAKDKAEIIAKAQGKKLGEIIHVYDKNDVNVSQHVSMYYDQPVSFVRYDIEVIFGLK